MLQKLLGSSSHPFPVSNAFHLLRRHSYKQSVSLWGVGSPTLSRRPLHSQSKAITLQSKGGSLCCVFSPFHREERHLPQSNQRTTGLIFAPHFVVQHEASHFLVCRQCRAFITFAHLGLFVFMLLVNKGKNTANTLLRPGLHYINTASRNAECYLIIWLANYAAVFQKHFILDNFKYIQKYQEQYNKSSCLIIQLQCLSNHGQSCFPFTPTKATLPLCYYEANIKYYPSIGISL